MSIITQKGLSLTNSEIYCDSRDLAKQFGKRHSSILKSINGLFDINNDIKKLDLFNKTTYVCKRNKTYPMYEMSIDGAIYFAEHTRANTKGRKDYLAKLYKEKGAIVVTQGVERRELEFTRELCHILDTFNIGYITQYLVGKYRIDLYIPTHNIAVEYDEFHHNIKEDKKRENFIKKTIECTFIRISDELELGQGIAKVLSKLLKEMI